MAVVRVCDLCGEALEENRGTRVVLTVSDAGAEAGAIGAGPIGARGKFDLHPDCANTITADLAKNQRKAAREHLQTARERRHGRRELPNVVELEEEP